MNKEKIKKAFRILPHQGTGNYHFDNCSHGEHIELKATDPFEYVNICPACLAIALTEREEVTA